MIQNQPIAMIQNQPQWHYANKLISNHIWDTQNPILKREWNYVNKFDFKRKSIFMKSPTWEQNSQNLNSKAKVD